MSHYSITALLNIPQEAGYYFPERNLVSISGNYLYQVMIDKLQDIEQIGKIIVNTDSDRIRNYRKVSVINAYHSDLQESEMELTSDKATAALLKEADGEHFLQLGPIFPFLRQQTIEQVIATYDSHVVNPEEDYERYQHDSVFTTRIFNRRYYDNETELVREDRPNTFIEDGILHVFIFFAFEANGNRKVGKRPYAYGIEEIENHAIDSDENYKIARYIDENRHFFPRVFSR